MTWLDNHYGIILAIVCVTFMALVILVLATVGP
jgi:hypothetical protein